MNILLVIAVSSIFGLSIKYILVFLIRRITRKEYSSLFSYFNKHLSGPLNLLFPVFFMSIIFPISDYIRASGVVASKILNIAWISVLSWILIKLPDIISDVVLSRYKLDARDNLTARKIFTQIQVLKKIFSAVVIFLAFAAVLTSFDKVRQLGTSILASAGLIGIIIGFAAQKIVSNLLAGIQIAITQPIRVDDVVIVENEWGRIEEITLTYVVVKIWDLRRLILPISYFIERPFQNWTRNSADILGSVFIQSDYSLPVDRLRLELRKILEDSGLWDGKVCVLQVTDAKKSTMELRALMSAENASKAWDLRCIVREKLISFIRDKYPESLPRIRFDANNAPVFK